MTKTILPLLSILALAGCGALDQAKDEAAKPGTSAADKGGGGAKAKESLNLEDIQLKSAGQLATHSENVFGAGMDKQAQVGGGNNQAPPKSVFEIYQNNFGSEAGLKVGDKFGDAPTEAYFMGLAIVGETIARNCQSDVITKGEKSKCHCATEATAKSLLSRAFVHWDFETAQNKKFVAKFSKGCVDNYKATINGMVMSLAYALRR